MKSGLQKKMIADLQLQGYAQEEHKNPTCARCVSWRTGVTDLGRDDASARINRLMGGLSAAALAKEGIGS